MANLWYGVGDTYAKTKNLTSGTGVGQEIIIPLYLFEFEYTEDVTKIEAKGQVGGSLKTLASAPGETTSTLRLSTQFVNWSQLGFFLNQIAFTTASVSIPVLKTGKVPASTPYEITDTAITSTTAAGVYVYVTTEGQESYRENAVAAPTTGEVQVNGTTNKIIFNAADAGRNFVYTVPVARTNVQTYGGVGGEKYGTVEFWGKVYGTEDTIHFPSLDFSTSPSFSFTGDVATLEVEFSANVDVASNSKFPYIIYKK